MVTAAGGGGAAAAALAAAGSFAPVLHGEEVGEDKGSSHKTNEADNSNGNVLCLRKTCV